MYKIFGFEPDWRFGRVARVEFSIPARGKYAYLLGNFNAFNEGSFRMERKGERWRITLRLPEGVWYYGFSVDGEFLMDPENPDVETYRKLSYKLEKEASVARIVGEGEFFHRPSATYLYSIAGGTHVLLRARRGKTRKVRLILDESEVPMKRKAFDELFEYYEAILPGEGVIRYSLIVESEGKTIELGPFEAKPYRYNAPGWIHGRVFYQIMPDRFERGLPGTPRGRAFAGEGFHGGDLAGIIRRLDHIESLGANALYITPVFESTTYHRYDVTDYFHIDRKLGGDGTFLKLAGELKKRDIKLVLDGVFHHTSFFHPFFQDLIARGNESDYKDFYRVTGFPVVSGEFLEVLRSKISPREKHRRLKEIGWNYESFYSVWLMPRLNHENPEVKRLVKDVMMHWLEKGADGWRLDVAHGVPPELWREVRKALPKDAYLVGEVMDDPRLWLFDKFHGTMNYPLYELILRFFVEREIDAGEFLNGLELLSAHLGPAEYAMYNFIDNHDTERFIDLVNDERRYLCALAFLMTYKGIPSIFYGDEIGLRGKLEGGLDAGRTPMEWNPEGWNERILETTRKLIELRKRSKALQLGDFIPLRFEGDEIIYERALGKERVRVEIRYTKNPEECRFKLFLSHLKRKYWKNYSPNTS
ncbi:cyclomaltodextrinase [Thermococcus cleftensis]|uniref:Cyclomaltodextrinase n=1 Tax=Thermococcus cleftensis (strain DSM 27260 / KACC 17922 / CL1) TaxID=163003 RepID=I3ZTQ5_THECF|nr:alpha amylase N-terminal ig-like domain-containing protein [Thermococcus cleftensis]AFL95089.1 cyclomaltodextrinase [Thermococcus cleftensis]